jgi:DNA-binding PadR family transcriptional regulator
MVIEISGVASKIPRGFTRYYVLYLLAERSLTGKEIIDEANKQSDGDWEPSPGLIYPLLGRLVREGLVKEINQGGYAITEKGEEVLMEYSKIQEQLDRQFELVNKLGISVYTKGKFLAVEALDRIRTITSTMSDRISKRSSDVQKNFDKIYEEFLKNELDRLYQKRNEDLQE